MPNKKLADEWLIFAEKSLETAMVLNKANHYTDVIAIDIQQSIEKAFKAVYVFNGEKIPRIHNLEVLFNYVSKYINLEDINIRNLLIVSDYYQTERYPGPKYFMPERKEIIVSIHLAKQILLQIQKYIGKS